MLTTLSVNNYRSLQDLVIPLSPLTVITGDNGSGKSNLYRALRLLGDAASGRAKAKPKNSVLAGAPSEVRLAAIVLLATSLQAL